MQNSQVEGLSVLTNIAELRMHHCYGLQNTWKGLHALLIASPKLEVRQALLNKIYK